MRRFVAVLLALLAAAPAFAEDVRPYLLIPATGQSVRQTAQTTGAANTFIANPSAGVAFYQPGTIFSLRENFAGPNSGSGVGLVPHWADSTVVIPTLGAKRIEVWLYAVHDTLTNVTSPSGVDSAKVVVFAVLPKAHLTGASADSGNSAYWQALRNPTQSDSLPFTGKRISGDFGGMIGSMLTTAARTTSAGLMITPQPNVSFANAILPGEIIVPYTRNWTIAQGSGIPPWTKFDICTSDGGCFTSEYISLRIRVMGHATVWPALGLVARTENRFAVRVDVKGYYQ